MLLEHIVVYNTTKQEKECIEGFDQLESIAKEVKTHEPRVQMQGIGLSADSLVLDCSLCAGVCLASDRREFAPGVVNYMAYKIKSEVFE